jgi:hypothetical protein
MTVTATKIDSSHESGKNFITWEWSTSTTIIYNNPVHTTFTEKKTLVCPVLLYIFVQISFTNKLLDRGKYSVHTTGLRCHFIPRVIVALEALVK